MGGSGYLNHLQPTSEFYLYLRSEGFQSVAEVRAVAAWPGVPSCLFSTELSPIHKLESWLRTPGPWVDRTRGYSA